MLNNISFLALFVFLTPLRPIDRPKLRWLRLPLSRLGIIQTSLVSALAASSVHSIGLAVLVVCADNQYRLWKHPRFLSK